MLKNLFGGGSENSNRRSNSGAKRKRNRHFKIEGKFNFHLEVAISTTVPYTSSNITVTAFGNSNTKIPIGATYRWARVSGNRIYKLSEIVGNTFQPSAKDIGTHLPDLTHPSRSQDPSDGHLDGR